jgi:hypothetical protein
MLTTYAGAVMRHRASAAKQEKKTTYAGAAMRHRASAAKQEKKTRGSTLAPGGGASCTCGAAADKEDEQGEQDRVL